MARVSDPTFLKPRFGFSAYPIHRLEMRLEGVDLLNGAVRPFGLDSPVITVAQYYAKNGLSHHAESRTHRLDRRPQINFTCGDCAMHKKLIGRESETADDLEL
jgi:hypothetical protein